MVLKHWAVNPAVLAGDKSLPKLEGVQEMNPSQGTRSLQPEGAAGCEPRVGQKRDESAGPCTPDCDRRPAGAIDEAGVDGVKHGAAPARANKVRVPQADGLAGRQAE